MGRGVKIGIGVVLALIALLVVNTLILDGEGNPVTVCGPLWCNVGKERRAGAVQGGP